MKIIMYPSVTLDGLIAKPDGDSDSWINEDEETLFLKAVERCGCVLVGRKTYEQYREEFDSDKKVVTFVCTHDSRQSDTDNIKFLNGTPQDMLEKIEKEGFPEIVISGGGEINGLFASAGLVDEIVASIYPVILGEGIPLFGSHEPQLKLKLLSSKKSYADIVQNNYKVLK